MEFQTQQYLRSGKTLEDLSNEYGIKSHISGPLVMLNYSMLTSDLSQVIPRECRALLLVPGSPIDITYLAQDDKGADRLFKKLREDVNRCSFFEPFLKDNNSKNLTFVSESDRHKRDITPTLTVWSLPCTTNAVRGPSSVFLALDEFAQCRLHADFRKNQIRAVEGEQRQEVAAQQRAFGGLLRQAGDFALHSLFGLACVGWFIRP